MRYNSVLQHFDYVKTKKTLTSAANARLSERLSKWNAEIIRAVQDLHVVKKKLFQPHTLYIASEVGIY